MLNLTLTTDKLRVVTASSGSIDVHTSYADLKLADDSVTPGRTNTAISTATTTDIVAAPASGDVRNVRYINVRNKHATTSNAITVTFDQNGTVFELWKGTLLAGEEAIYNEGVGWQVYDAGGRYQADGPCWSPA